MVGRSAGLAAALFSMVFADDCDGEYAAFVSKFGKTETPERKAVFCANLQHINEQNSANPSYTLGVNVFSDWTEEEFTVLLGGKATNYSDPEVQANLWEPPADYAPSNAMVDWRSRMPPVKDQGQCGSCWAFAALDVVDFAAGGSHSEQEALDCVTDRSSCQGGNPSAALQALARLGSISESSYPYTGFKGYCQAQGKPVSARVSGVRPISGEYNIAAAVSRQVVSVCISGGSALQHYQGGVWDQDCGGGGGHCIGVVGYTDDYWILRNSWTASWGLGGYFYFKRGRNLCTIGTRGAVVAQAQGTGPSPTPTPTPPFPPYPPSPTPPYPPFPPSPPGPSPFPSCNVFPRGWSQLCTCTFGCGPRPSPCHVRDGTNCNMPFQGLCCSQTMGAEEEDSTAFVNELFDSQQGFGGHDSHELQEVDSQNTSVSVRLTLDVVV